MCFHFALLHDFMQASIVVYFKDLGCSLIVLFKVKTVPI